MTDDFFLKIKAKKFKEKNKSQNTLVSSLTTNIRQHGFILPSFQISSNQKNIAPLEFIFSSAFHLILKVLQEKKIFTYNILQL